MTQTLAENFIILHQQENLQVDQNDRLLVTILDTAYTAGKIFAQDDD